MIVAIAVGISVLFAAGSVVKRRASVKKPAAAAPVVTPVPADAIVYFLDTYRQRRAEAMRGRRASHSGS